MTRPFLARGLAPLSVLVALTLSLPVPWTVATADQEPPGEFIDADPAWVETNQAELERQFTLLVAAYGLDETQQAALRQEMQARLFQQKAFEDKELRELNEMSQKLQAAGEDDSSPEAQAIVAKIAEMSRSMPLNEEGIVTWVEKIVPPARVAESRQRWEELRVFQDQRSMPNEAAIGESIALKETVRETRTTNEAAVLPGSGEPVPSGEKGERVWPVETKKRADQARVVPPNFDTDSQRIESQAKKVRSKPPYWKVRPEDDTATPVDGTTGTDDQTIVAQPITPAPPASVGQAGPAVVTPQPTQKPIAAAPQPLQPAPPLDDWDKFVLAQADRFQFDKGQMTNAQSILRDLKRRANQYRLSRAEDFAKAQLNISAKSREEELRRLNRPIDALFEELKQRIESLPTVQQRQQAEKTAKPASPRK